MILAGRERESPLVAEDLVYDGIESLLGDRIREGFVLRADELVLSAENADADLHSVGIAFVFLFGQAEVAGTMQAEGVVKTRQSAGIASRKSNDFEIAALEDQPRCNRFAVASSPEDIVAIRWQIGEILDAVQQNVGFQAPHARGLVDRFVGQERQRDSSHFRPCGIAKHAQRRRARNDGLHAGAQLVGPVSVGTLKAVIAAAWA